MGEMLVRKSMVNSAVVGLGVRMGPKVPSERDEGRRTASVNVARSKDATRMRRERSENTGKNTVRELVLNRCRIATTPRAETRMRGLMRFK